MHKLFTFILVGFVLITSTVHAQNTLKRSPELSKYHSALDLIHKEKYASAQQQFEEIEKVTHSPLMKAEVEFYIALCALHLEQPQAEGLFLEFIENNPSDPKMNLALHQMGSYYYRKQKFSKASEYLAQVDFSYLEEDERFEAEFYLGYSYFVQKKLKEAEQQFDKIKGKEHNYKYASNYYSGYIKFLDGNYDKAVRDLKVAEENGVYAQIVPYMIVNIYYKKTDYQALVKYAEPVLKSDKKVSKKKEILLLTAESYFMMEDYPKAGKYFDLYIKHGGKGNKEIVYRAGYSALKNSESEKAIEYFKEIADSKDSLGQYASYYLGESYLAQGNKQYALTALKEASKTDYNKYLQEAAAYDVARLHYELEQFDLAIAALNTFDKKYPNSSKSAKIQELVSDAYVYTNNYDAALKYLESKPALSPKMKANYQQVAYQKALDLYNKRKINQSLVYLDKSISTPSDKTILGECYYWKGEALSRLRKWDEAKNAYAFVFRNSSERSITFANSRYGIGYAYFNTADYKKAKEHFSKFISSGVKLSSKVKGDAMLRMADCYFLEKKYKDAEAKYKGAIESKVPRLDYAYYQLGMVSEANDNIGDADKYLAKVETDFAKSPLRVKASYNRARIAFEDGNYRQAEKLFSSYLSSYKKDKMVSFAYLQRAKTYYNLKNYPSSLADYDVILTNYCLDSVATDALEGAQQTLNVMGQSEAFDQRLADFKVCNPNNKSLEKTEFSAGERDYLSSNFPGAIKKLTGFVKDYPESSYKKQAVFYLADAYYIEKNYDSSIVYYKQVVEDKTARKYDKHLIKLSRMLVKKERYAEAKEVSLELLSVASSGRKQSEALTTLITSLHFLGQHDSTVAFAAKVINDPAAPDYKKIEAYFFSAKSNWERDSLNLATDQFLYIVNNSAEEMGAESNYNVALILYQQEKYQQSLEVLYEMNKSYGTYAYWLGKSFLLIAENNVAMGEDFQARATLNSIIEHSTEDSIVQEAKDRLTALDKIKEEAEKEEAVLIDQVDLSAPAEKAIQQVDSSNVENE